MNDTQKLLNALLAIRARIYGEWDHPALVQFGALSTDPEEDILKITSGVLATIDPDEILG